MPKRQMKYNKKETKSEPSRDELLRENESLKGKVAELEKKVEEMDKLKDENAKLKDENAKLKEKVAKLEALVTKLSKRLDALESQNGNNWETELVLEKRGQQPHRSLATEASSAPREKRVKCSNVPTSNVKRESSSNSPKSQDNIEAKHSSIGSSSSDKLEPAVDERLGANISAIRQPAENASGNDSRSSMETIVAIVTKIDRKKPVQNTDSQKKGPNSG